MVNIIYSRSNSADERIQYLNVAGTGYVDTVSVRACFWGTYMQVREGNIFAIGYSNMVSLAINVSYSLEHKPIAPIKSQCLSTNTDKPLINYICYCR